MDFKNILKTTRPDWLGVTLILFGLSIYTSKSGISLFGFVLIVYSIFNSSARNQWIKSWPIWWLAGLYPLGAIISALVSIREQDFEILTKYLISWPWPLLAIPGAVIYQKRERVFELTIGLVLGLIISVGTALWKWGTIHDFTFNERLRLVSFWEIGYWGSFLAVTLVVIYCILITIKFRDEKLKFSFLTILFISSAVALALVNTRGPWLAVALTLTAASFWTNKGRKAFGIFILAVSFAFATSEDLQSRARSIFSVKVESDRITSENKSNAGRLHMWKVALDFFQEQPFLGTGFENTEKRLRAFIDRQSQDYQLLYTKTEFSYKDQHSSYISLLVQMGIFFSIFFWATISYFGLRILGTTVENLKKGSVLSFICLGVLFTHLIIFVFYSSVLSYEMVTLFPLLGAWTLDQNKFNQLPNMNIES